MSSPTPIIELKDVHRTYKLGDTLVHALAGVTLTIDEGEFVAIMGTSGSGKSTLMNLLGCLDQPSKGSYLLRGKEVSGKSRDELADIRNHEIGFVFQSFHLLARTSAVENVELPLVYRGEPSAQRRAKATAALQRVELGQRLDHVPSQLSGGQQQRVAIARAIVTEPRVLLADEPTGNLDSKTTVDIMALLQELGREGRTVVLVTHEPEVAVYAKRIITVRDGLIASDVTQTPKDARLDQTGRKSPTGTSL